MVIIVENGVPKQYSLEYLKRDNPMVSFPENIPDELLAEYGVYRVIEDKKPEIDNLCETVTQSDFYQDSEGKWHIGYETELLSKEKAAENIRKERDKKLKESDWMMLPDCPHGSKETRLYRHLLRNIPQQKNFPFDVDWPTL